MIFKRKFFLELGEDKPLAQPAVEASVKEVPQAAVVPVAPASTEPVLAAGEPAAAPATTGERVLTTAEAIAAELAASQANRPAPSVATFAPANLVAGGELPRRRRSGGANLAAFKEMGRAMKS